MDAVTHTVYKPTFILEYEQKDITHTITPYLLEVSYTDYMSGQSDEISIKLEDVDGRWMDAWYPDAGDGLVLSLPDEMGQLLVMGRFEISEIDYHYPPSVISIKAMATGITKANRTNQPKVYKNVTLADIVRQIAHNLKLSVSGKIKDIKIQSVTQYQERDVEFLTRLAHTYGHSFKILDKTLMFYDNAELGKRESVATLNKADMMEYGFRDLIKSTPKEVQVTAYNTTHKKKVSAKAKPKGRRTTAKKPTTTDTLKIVAPNNATQSEVDAIATAHANNSENEQIAAEVRLVGNAKLVAGQVVILDNVGKFGGKYLIKQATHTLSPKGYLTDLDMVMLEYIAPNANENTNPKPEPNKTIP